MPCPEDQLYRLSVYTRGFSTFYFLPPVMSNHGPLFQLDADSTDCLLTTLHDFQSLRDFVFSSKFVYSVFQSRKNTILGAVAHNQFGPALPQAMRVVRCLGGNHTLMSVYERRQEADSDQDFMISPMQVRLLRDHAATVRKLEDIYSWREKDPRSRTSRLTAAESLRFQQSVYRFWLLASAYGPATLAYERPEYSSKAIELKHSVITKQITFLLSLGEKELIGVDEVHSFLLDLAKWALAKQSKRAIGHHIEEDDDYVVWSGPAVTLDTLMGNRPYSGYVDSHWRGMWRAMSHAFHATEIASITGRGATSAFRQRFILSDLFLETIHCSHCRQSHPQPGWRDSLWSRCNWEYMVLVLPPPRLLSFLTFERKRPLEMLVLFAEAVGSIPYHVFIEEVFDIRSERYQNWNKDDWLCIDCMTGLLSDNLQPWFDEKMTKAVDSH